MAVRQGFVVAIDGPAGAGKGTMARRIADHFRLNLLDTGLSYRAVAHDMLKGGLALDDEAAAVRAAEAVDLGALDREILSQHAVGEAASRIAVIPAVRRVLVDKQRRFARTPPGAVLDGRDIGTVVCPDAAVKIYVTASAAARPNMARSSPISSAVTPATPIEPIRRCGPPPTRTCSIRAKWI
jgi:cytidylate kinase